MAKVGIFQVLSYKKSPFKKKKKKRRLFRHDSVSTESSGGRKQKEKPSELKIVCPGVFKVLLSNTCGCLN